MFDPDDTYTVEQLDADLLLIQRARQLYPDSDYLQAEWLRAVMVVRDTNGGWVLEIRQARLDKPFPVIRPRDLSTETHRAVSACIPGVA